MAAPDLSGSAARDPAGGFRRRRRLARAGRSTGVRWAALLVGGSPLQRVRGGRVELRVPPTPARYLRITQTGRDERWRWTVRELFLYADAGGPSSADEPAWRARSWRERLRDAGVTRLYADHGWASRAALADPAIRVPPPTSSSTPTGSRARSPTSCRPSAGRRGLAPSSSRRTPLDSCSQRAAPVSRSGPPARGARAVRSRAISAAPRPSDGGAGADVTASQRPRAGLPGGGRRPQDPLGHQGPTAAGDWFRIDLAAPRRVRTVRFTASQPDDLPEALRIEGSADGTGWWKVPTTAHVERALRWGGIALLADAAAAVRLDVEPVVVRALRLVLSQGHPVANWSIHELELLRRRLTIPRGSGGRYACRSRSRAAASLMTRSFSYASSRSMGFWMDGAKPQSGWSTMRAGST